MERLIDSVGDTARWVAAYRALETDRPDAIFRDPYARRLAGPRGKAIVRGLAAGAQSAWAVVVRTAALDEMLLKVLGETSTGCVLNLAAGLDARPYRLALAAHLRWVEVDLPATIAYKEGRLADERPRCLLERFGLDLTDPGALAELLDRIDQAGMETLVLTEGLLVYLERQEVIALSSELSAHPHLCRWLLDMPSAGVLGHGSVDRLQRQLEAGAAFMKFAPPEGAVFFSAQGWRPLEVRGARDEARRLGREPRWSDVAQSSGQPPDWQPSGQIAQYVLLEHGLP